MRSSFVALLVLLASVAAGCHRPDPPPPPPVSSAIATSSTAIATACAPWDGRGFRVTTRAWGGRGDFYTELRYDDAAGTIAVDDSDPFATGTGKEAVVPRRTRRTVTLEDADRTALAKDLLAICPDARAFVAPPEPTTGGGTNLDVVSATGVKRSVYDFPTARQVHARLRHFFPELRASKPGG